MEEQGKSLADRMVELQSQIDRASIEMLSIIAEINSDSPAFKFRKLELNSKFHETKESQLINETAEAYKKLLKIANYLNIKSNLFRINSAYVSAAIDYKSHQPTHVECGALALKPLFLHYDDAEKSFDYLTDKEIELLYGVKINRKPKNI